MLVKQNILYMNVLINIEDMLQEKQMMQLADISIYQVTNCQT